MPKTHHPVTLFELEPGNKGYEEGARYRIDTVDSTNFFFPEIDQAYEFMDLHGMKHINAEEMETLREALSNAGSDLLDDDLVDDD